MHACGRTGCFTRERPTHSGRRRSFWSCASEGTAAAIASLRAPDRRGDAAENEEALTDEDEEAEVTMKLSMTPLTAVLASSSSFDHPKDTVTLIPARAELGAAAAAITTSSINAEAKTKVGIATTPHHFFSRRRLEDHRKRMVFEAGGARKEALTLHSDGEERRSMKASRLWAVWVGGRRTAPRHVKHLLVVWGRRQGTRFYWRRGVGQAIIS
ncbi:hypothetical protein B296_00030679 [Ensete ventricosum]|uniref:Uncharacterized protein n=1 Tax=Ensete ventricosum TaxID=4639 RepID=A0A426YEY6_ENSVE|nr:hypothetical protein B296_00030679 [Ensete ventricosum]